MSILASSTIVILFSSSTMNHNYYSEPSLHRQHLSSKMLLLSEFAVVKNLLCAE